MNRKSIQLLLAAAMALVAGASEAQGLSRARSTLQNF